MGEDQFFKPDFFIGLAVMAFLALVFWRLVRDEKPKDL